MTERFLYKYLSISDPSSWPHLRQLLADREIYFSDPKNFNDPLDCNLSSAVNLQGAMYDCGIFCLAGENRDDALMFAHYGDHHRGFRLTFSIDENLSLGEIGVFGMGSEVDYRKTVPVFNIANIHKSRLIKSLSWKYEDEYRIFHKVEGVNSPRLLRYGTQDLVEVAFGHRMNPDFEPVIKNWIRLGGHEKVTFLRAIPSKNILNFEYAIA
ncbi:MAG: DUF2971 domain-containing protein [Gallionella sp.]|nr:DUF2971 domain-containing protein [Gallionella sp.]